MERFGDYKVLARHSHGADAVRVWVEHVRTGERSFHILTMNGVK